MNNFSKLMTLVESKQENKKPTGYPKIEPLKTFCTECSSPMQKRTIIRFKGYNSKSGEAKYTEVSHDICSLTKAHFWDKPFLLLDRKMTGYVSSHDEPLWD